MASLGAVGAAATAPKSKTGLAGEEVFDPRQGCRISATDNGGYVLNISMKKVQKGVTRGGDYPSYCPDRVEAFESLESAVAALTKRFGGK